MKTPVAAAKRIADNDALSSILLRSATLPVSALSVIVTTKIVIESAGIENYAIFSILITLPLLIPISDFGISVAITDAVAKHGTESKAFYGVWRSSRRMLLVISALTVCAGLAVTTASLWSELLGVPESTQAEIAGFIMTTHLALTIYLGAGQRVLLGLQKQKLFLVFSITAAPLSLLMVSLAVRLQPNNLAAVVLCYSIGQLVPAIFCYLYACKQVPPKKKACKATAVFSYRPILRTAFPMMIISIALPLTYQSDRVFLAHQGTTIHVAEYSLASTVYMPVLSILTVGSQSLWPMFMNSQRENANLRQSYKTSLFWFSTLGAGLMVAYWTLAPLVAGFMSPDVSVDPYVFFFFGIMLFIFGVHASPGMLLMDFRGRMFQAAGSVAMLMCKVPLTVLLVANYGSPGAILGTILPLICFMTAPCLILCLYRTRGMGEWVA